MRQKKRLRFANSVINKLLAVKVVLEKTLLNAANQNNDKQEIELKTKLYIVCLRSFVNVF